MTTVPTRHRNHSVTLAADGDPSQNYEADVPLSVGINKVLGWCNILVKGFREFLTVPGMSHIKKKSSTIWSLSSRAVQRSATGVSVV